jgi:hypothetical protein
LSHITWVDECYVIGDEDLVKDAKEQMNSRFDCDDNNSLSMGFARLKELEIMYDLLNLFCCKVTRTN